jgi:hypothetical protein
MSGPKPTAPARPTPAPPVNMAASAAEIDKAKKKLSKEGPLGADVTEEAKPNLRRLLDEASMTAEILDHRLRYGLESMGEKERTAAMLCVKKYKNILNDPSQSDENRAKAVGELKNFASCREMGGKGGNLRQFCSAALKGMGSQDWLLGLVLAILFFLIRKGMEAYRLNQAEQTLRKYNEHCQSIGAKTDLAVTDALKLEIDKRATRTQKMAEAETALKAGFGLGASTNLSDMSFPTTPTPQQTAAVNKFKATMAEIHAEDRAALESAFEEHGVTKAHLAQWEAASGEAASGEASSPTPTTTSSPLSETKKQQIDDLVKRVRGKSDTHPYSWEGKLDRAINDYMGSAQQELMKAFPPEPAGAAATGASATSPTDALAEKFKSLRGADVAAVGADVGGGAGGPSPDS